MDRWVWTTTDLVNWTLVDTLQPSGIKWDTPAEVHECWATDAAQRNGECPHLFELPSVSLPPYALATIPN
jgi:beta-xylosidase